MVTPVLFERWPGPAALAQAPLSEVEDVLHPLGFFRSKARHVIDASQMIMAEFGGEVPRTMEELTRLPGVGRKTANIVLNNAFDIVEGIAVDTHVHRIATRLGFTKAAAPLDAEQDLLKLIPQELWKPVNHQVGALWQARLRRQKARLRRRRASERHRTSKRAGVGTGGRRHAVPACRCVPGLRQGGARHEEGEENDEKDGQEDGRQGGRGKGRNSERHGESAKHKVSA